jgi:hypothetical protein
MCSIVAGSLGELFRPSDATQAIAGPLGDSGGVIAAWRRWVS